MRILKIKSPNPYRIAVPEWFMNNRGDGGITFEKLQQNGEIEEIGIYKHMREFMSKFPKDSIFLDIGAQMGLSTLSVASDRYNVIAVEPVASNIQILQENIDLNGFDKVKIANIAAFHENRDITIYVPHEEDCASLSVSAANIPGATNVKSETVKAMRIYDWLIQNHIDTDTIKFVKIDVQGAEEMVIDGMEELLDKDLHILMEWDSRMMNSMGTNEQSFFNKLVSKGFSGTRWGHNDILFSKNK
jgi:FkbM family methyltransferase